MAKDGKKLRGRRRKPQPPAAGAIPTSSSIVVPKTQQRFYQRSRLERFTSNGTISAAVMVAAALLAVMVANSPAYEFVHHLFETELSLGFGPYVVSLSFEAFVNDFLMAIFFLLVGIELKYEFTVGQLRRPRQAMLPMLGACGGVAVPALIYLLLNWGGATNGWAIPIATDIAFALGVASLLGKRIASETKIFFQTLAIADDILAILVLALFYGQSPNIAWLAAALIVVVALASLNRAQVYSAKPYLVLGFILWICLFNSGIHATLAGVILAFFLPAKTNVRVSELKGWLDRRAEDLDSALDTEAYVLGQHDFTSSARKVEKIAHLVTPPLERVEGYFSVLVNFFILPLFAFVNAQVRLVGVDLTQVIADPVTQGVFFGAVLGKPLGIISVTWLLVKIRFAKLPRHVTWDQVIVVGIMGAIGFTMSILIAGLAFPSPTEVMGAKTAILVGSVVASVFGIGFVRIREGLAALSADRSVDEPDSDSRETLTAEKNLDNQA